MPEDTSMHEQDGAGTAPAENEDVEPRTFTQEDVDRIVTERLRRERQRTEKAVRDEFEARIAELEASQEEAHQARNDAETLSGALRGAEKRALIAERLLAKGTKLPPPYLAIIDGEDAETVDAAIDAAREQWVADLRQFTQPRTDVGAPLKAAAQVSRPTRIDEGLAERMRRGEAEAFREYRALRS